MGRQDHWHCLRVDRLDYGVRCRGQETIDLMRSGNWLGLSSAVALELGPCPPVRAARPRVGSSNGLSARKPGLHLIHLRRIDAVRALGR
jgi:hypothetical protein